MNLDESCCQPARQLAIIDALKPCSRGQLAIIDALREVAQQLDVLHTFGGLIDRQLEAGWRQLDQLQAAFATVVVDQRRPSPDLQEDTAEIDLAEVARDLPPALRLSPIVPE